MVKQFLLRKEIFHSRKQRSFHYIDQLGSGLPNTFRQTHSESGKRQKTTKRKQRKTVIKLV